MMRVVAILACLLAIPLASAHSFAASGTLEYTCVKVSDQVSVLCGLGRHHDTTGSTGEYEATFTLVSGSGPVRVCLYTFVEDYAHPTAETCAVTSGTVSVTVPASATDQHVGVFVRSAAAPPVVGVEPRVSVDYAIVHAD